MDINDETPKALEHFFTVEEYVCLPGDRTAWYAINKASGIMCPGRDTYDLALQDAEALNAAVKRATESLRARYLSMSDRHWTCLKCGGSWNCEKNDAPKDHGNSSPSVPCPYCEITRLRARVAELEKIESEAKAAGMIGPDGRLRKLLGRLPLTADGCIFGIDAPTVYAIYNGKVFGAACGAESNPCDQCGNDDLYIASEVYSTRKAAEAALAAKKGTVESECPTCGTVMVRHGASSQAVKCVNCGFDAEKDGGAS